MLSEQHLAILRSEPGANRVAKALSLAGVTQTAQITVESARKFARYFGCCIEDLFPPPDQ